MAAYNIPIDESFVHRAQSYDTPLGYALRSELERWQFYDLAPKQMNLAGTFIDTPVLLASGKNLASFFYTMKTRQPRQFAQVQRELSMIIPQIDEFDVTVNERAEVDLTVHEHGSRFSAKLLIRGDIAGARNAGSEQPIRSGGSHRA